MPNTHTLIQSVTVGSAGAASIEFGSIPQTYTDLVIYLTTRSTYGGVGDDGSLFFNGLTTGRTCRFLYGNGSSAAGATEANDGFFTVSDTATANVFSTSTIHIPNYTSAINKSFSSDTAGENSGLAYLAVMAGLWSNTAAITSIQIVTAGSRGVWKQYSSASLYGIKNS